MAEAHRDWSNMSLRFCCPHCQADVVVSQLRVGERALCRTCGKTTVIPATATETDELVDYSNAIVLDAAAETAAGVPPLPFAGKKAWSPKGIHWLGWFFSPLPAGIAWALNYERLGQPEKKLGAFLFAVAAFVVVVLFSLIPGFPGPVILGLNGCFAALYYYTQRDIFRKFVEQGGERASFKLPVVNSIALAVLVFGIEFGILKYEENRLFQRVDEVTALLEAEELVLAKSKLEELRVDYPEESVVYMSLSVIYLAESDFDSALVNANHALRLQPSEPSTLAFRRLIISYMQEERLQFDSAITGIDFYLQYAPDDIQEIDRRASLRARASSSLHKRD